MRTAVLQAPHMSTRPYLVPRQTRWYTMEHLHLRRMVNTTRKWASPRLQYIHQPNLTSWALIRARMSTPRRMGCRHSAVSRSCRSDRSQGISRLSIHPPFHLRSHGIPTNASISHLLHHRAQPHHRLQRQLHNKVLRQHSHPSRTTLTRKRL